MIERRIARWPDKNGVIFCAMSVVKRPSSKMPRAISASQLMTGSGEGSDVIFGQSHEVRIEVDNDLCIGRFGARLHRASLTHVPLEGYDPGARFLGDPRRLVS